MTEQLDAWERRESATYRAIPYFMLVASTGFALGFSPEEWALTLLLAGITLAWLLGTQRRGPRAVHLAGLLVLIAALILHNPLFGFFGISGYLAADGFPGRWMYAGVVWTAFWMGTSQVGGLPLPDSTPVWAWLAVVAVNVVVASLLMAYGAAIEGRNRQLKEALAENDALAREAGIQEERRRMAGEIHDTLAQGLTGIVAQLEALDHAQRRGGDWRRHLDTAAQLARESLSEARRSVRAIGPGALEDARLPDAIAEVARSWSSINGIEAEVVTTGTARPMHPDVEVTLLRTAQEALANVGRHAHASRVGVTLSYMEDVVTLDIRDDGVGFTPNGSPGFGLTAMRQRVQRVDGRLDVESEPGAGTAVSASVPAREAT
jgi:signal transduction histidine kinase